MLSTGTRPATRRHIKIAIIELKLSLRPLWENGNSHCAGLHSAASLSRRNTLPAMTTSLATKTLVGIVADNPQNNLRFAFVNNLNAKDKPVDKP